MARKKKNESLEKYSGAEIEAVTSHIEEHFGIASTFFEQNDPKYLKMEILLIPASREQPFTTMVTRGMGAHLMNVPDDLKKHKLSRAELVICFPANWKVNTEDSSSSWPLDLLSHLARLPVKENAWLGWGHTVDYSFPFAENTELSAVLLINSMFGKNSWRCELPDGDEVNFYQVIPLYPQEVNFKNARSADALLSCFGDKLDKVTFISRKPAVREGCEQVIDTVKDHSSKITAKELDIPEICGANHIAAFFRWCMEQELLDEEFSEFMAEEIGQMRSGELDVRKFIINCMGGEFTKDVLGKEGQAFADYYYDFFEDDPSYPGDVDKAALEYFGEEKYNCEEFGDEAYLFVPYNEAYYNSLCRYISRNYRVFKREYNRI